MTRKGHKLDKIDEPPPIRKATTTNPWAGYLRCDECGADAGKVCRDMDDLPSIEVCEGRRLFLGDSADMTRRPKGDQVPQVPAPPKPPAPRKPPTYVACTNCHDPIKVTGIASKKDHLYCAKRECRRAYDREWQTTHIGPPVQHRCWWCGIHLSPVGRRREAKRPVCDNKECIRASSRQSEAERRERKKIRRGVEP
jgi:hypothetical protein